MKRIFFLFALLTLLSLPLTALADGTVSAYLKPGKTQTSSPYVYLEPGHQWNLDVNNNGKRTIYFKVVSSGGKIVKDGYIDGGLSGGTSGDAGVGNYKVVLKCTTGRTVYTDCKAEAHLTSFSD